MCLELLTRENIWLDSLQNRIYSTSGSGADAEDASEELDVRKLFSLVILSKISLD